MNKCTEVSSETNFVINSPSLPGVVHIQRGNIHTGENNQHGEGDEDMWHHSLSRPEHNFIISSSDRDIWIYGLLLTELSHQLQSKQVFVNCLNSSPSTYVNITRLYESVTAHPQLGKISRPCTSLVAFYIATASDYLSPDSWIKLVTSVYFYKFPKFFKSNNVSFVHNGVINTPTAHPFASNYAKMVRMCRKNYRIEGVAQLH